MLSLHLGYKEDISSTGPSLLTDGNILRKDIDDCMDPLPCTYFYSNKLHITYRCDQNLNPEYPQYFLSFPHIDFVEQFFPAINAFFQFLVVLCLLYVVVLIALFSPFHFPTAEKDF